MLWWYLEGLVETAKLTSSVSSPEVWNGSPPFMISM